MKDQLDQLFNYGPQIPLINDLLAIALELDRNEIDRIFDRFDHNLRRISVSQIDELIGEFPDLDRFVIAKIVSIFEIGRRTAAFLEDKPQISSPSDVARLLMIEMRELKNEILQVLCLDTKNFVIKKRKIFEGSLNASIIHPREVFRFAIRESAASIILVHNHPSGDPSPSQEDIRSTKQLIEAGKQIQIPVLDHVIIGDACYVSLKEDGYI